MFPAGGTEGVTSAKRIYQEESFGPMASVVVAADSAEAFRITNDKLYGLTFAIFSRDVAMAFDFSETDASRHDTHERNNARRRGSDSYW